MVTTPITTSPIVGAARDDARHGEREVIALLHAVAACPPGDWQRVAAALPHVAPTCASGSFSPAILRAHYERFITHFRRAILSNGAEGALPRSAELRRLLAQAAQVEDARARQDAGTLSGTGDREDLETNVRSASPPIRFDLADRRAVAADEAASWSLTFTLMVITSSNLVTRKRQWRADDSATRRVAHRGDSSSPSSLGASLTSSDNSTDTAIAGASYENVRSEVACSQDQTLAPPDEFAADLVTTCAQAVPRLSQVQHQSSRSTEVDVLKRQFKEMMAYVHRMRADFTEQVAHLSMTAAADKRTLVSVEKELNELREAHTKLKHANMEQRIAIARFQSDQKPRGQAAHTPRNVDVLSFVSLIEAVKQCNERQAKLKVAFVDLAGHMDRRATVSTGLKQDVLTLSNQIKMLERAVDACESLLRRHEDKLETNDRKFATLGRSLAAMHTTIKRTEEKLTDEVIKRAALQDAVATGRETLAQAIHSQRCARERVEETIRRECDRLLCQTSQSMVSQKQGELALHSIQCDVMALTERTAALERVQVASHGSAERGPACDTSDSAAIASVSSTLDHVETTLTAQVQERVALREALDAQQPHFDAQERRVGVVGEVATKGQHASSKQRSQRTRPSSSAVDSVTSHITTLSESSRVA